MALFTPDRGIDSFASLQALDEALHARLSGDDAGGGLLINITWQDQARARRSRKKLAAFIYTPVADNLFENRVDALLALQKQDIGHGWRLFPRHEVDGQQVHELFDRLADISSFLDIRGVLVERSRRYIEANMPSWYQQAPARDQHTLKRLAVTELGTNKALAALLRKEALPGLTEFSRKELIRQLAIDYPGLVIDPDKVQVAITTRLNPASEGGGVGPDQVPSTQDQGTPPERTVTLSLTELALKNSNPWDFSFYKLYTGERTAMSASGKTATGAPIQFNDNYLTTLIETLDVGQGYDQLLKTRLIDKGSALRKAWADANQASLATLALAAKLDSGCFLDDREQRGYQWIKAIIDGDSPDSRRTVGGHAIVASALLIGNSPGSRNGYILDNTLVIGVRNHQSVPNVILYAPWAPSGQYIKEFSDSTAMQQFLRQQWATSTEWRRSIMQRLSKSGQAALSESKIARTRLLSELILSTRSRVSNPFDNIHTLAINTPLHSALYEQQVVTLRRNADHGSTSNAQVAYQSLLNQLKFGLDLALDLISFLPITSAFNAARSVTRTAMLLKQMGASRSAARALWSITGARARPTTLSKVGALPAFRSAPDLSGVEVTVDPQSLDRLKGNLFQSKTSPQQYALIDGRHYLTDVAQGQRFIYPPGTARRTLRYPLALDESLKNWQAEPKLRLTGGMDDIEKGPQQTTFRDYELPQDDIAALPALSFASPGALNLGIMQPAMSRSIQAGILHMFAIQSRMRRHARAFFRQFKAPDRSIELPGRSLSTQQFIENLLSQRNGLVIGEQHPVALAREFLIRNMAIIKKQNVRGIYLEFFNTDLHQELLDQFNASPTAALPQLLKDRLQMVDNIYHRQGLFSYSRLVEEAHAHAIAVMALDSTASSLFSSKDLIPSSILPTLSDQLDRVVLFNFFAYKRIAAEQLAQGPHRWLALIGQGHANTLQNIPGLVELTNSTSIRLDTRVASQTTLRVKNDPGMIISSPLGTHPILLKCDLLACLPASANQHEIAMRVHSPGLFTTTTTPFDQPVLDYMNDQRQRVLVPVLPDSGQVYVSHAPFGALSERRFDDLDALTDALMDELGMIEV